MKNFFKRGKDEPKKEENPREHLVETISLAELEKMGQAPSQVNSEKYDPTLPYSDEFTAFYSDPYTQKGRLEPKDKKFESKDGKKAPYVPKSTFPIRPIIVDKKLTIILVEDTAEVAKEKEIAFKLIQNHFNPDIVKIIYYGKEMKENEYSKRIDINDLEFHCTEESGNESCLYDTLKYIGSYISDSYMKENGTDYRKERISQITIVGIGTCRDTCSKVSKEEAIKAFCKVIKNPGVMSKYFCLTEKSFLEAAEIGFRSIGSISRNYQ